MNPYLLIILATLVGAWLLGLAARTLNVRALRPEPPAGFEDVYDLAEYRRSQEYARATMRFENVSETLSVLVMVAFILGGGFNVVDQHLRALGLTPLVTGLLFFGVLGLGSALLSLPLDVWSTFVIEERFGFNRTTPATFVADKLKGWALSAVLGGALLAAVLWFFGAAGRWAWIWCWGFAAAFMLALVYVAPAWILPLFNKYTPLEDGELRTAIENYAESQGFVVNGIFAIDGSKRSSKANAFFTGLGAKKRIALYDTLIEKMSVDEIVAVLAHEIGHSRLGHVRRGLIVGMLKTGAIFGLMSLFLNSRPLFDAFRLEQVSIYAGLLFFLLLYSPVSMALAVAANAVSRRHERQADAFAAHTTGRPGDLVSALKTLTARNLSNLTPHRLTVVLQYGHPPVVERVRLLRAMEPEPRPEPREGAPGASPSDATA